mgnify:CR=1 FL=1
MFSCSVCLIFYMTLPRSHDLVYCFIRFVIMLYCVSSAVTMCSSTFFFLLTIQLVNDMVSMIITLNHIVLSLIYLCHLFASTVCFGEFIYHLLWLAIRFHNQSVWQRFCLKFSYFASSSLNLIHQSYISTLAMIVSYDLSSLHFNSVFRFLSTAG